MDIHQQESGSGPVVVMLHGLFGDADNFNGIAKLLAEDFRVIQLDLPGHGRSKTLPALTIEAMSDALIAHFSATQLSNFHLLGHSLGGKVSMCIAARSQAPQISRLIVADIAPRAYPPHHQTILQALNSLDLNALQSRKHANEQLAQSIPEAGIRSFLLKSLTRANNTNNGQSSSYQWRFDLSGLDQAYAAIRQVPQFDAMVSCPTLFIKGENSNYIAASDEHAIRQHFSQPSFKIIGNTGHWLHAEKPQQFARLCSDFLGA